MSTVRSAFTVPSLLGECPVWSSTEQVLYWLDIDGRLVHRFNPATTADETRELPGRPGSLATTHQTGRLLLAVEHQLLWFDWASGSLDPFVDLAAPSPDRLNDGRTDPAGRFVVGSIQADTAQPPAQRLYQVNSEGASSVLRGEITVTNGIAFDPVRQRMYFADTPTERVLAYDYDPESGVCENERLFVDYSEIPGKPDGACVDAEGYYWSASVYGWAVTRFAPTGELDRRIELPLEKPSMPAFGGPDLRTLYVTTIGVGGTVPSAAGRDGFVPGSLLAIDLDVAGVVDPPFNEPPPS